MRRRSPEKRRARARSAAPPSFAAEIYRVVRRIPRGRVATYGQVAFLSGHPGAARAVGRALSTLSPALTASVPWQRVVAASGKISFRDDDWPRRQRELLEREGVRLTRGGGVDLRRCQWQRAGVRGSAASRTSRPAAPRARGTARPAR